VEQMNLWTSSKFHTKKVLAQDHKRFICNLCIIIYGTN
jgi:hypothetical protein